MSPVFKKKKKKEKPTKVPTMYSVWDYWSLKNDYYYKKAEKWEKEMIKLKMRKKIIKTNQRIISKSHERLQTMTKILYSLKKNKKTPLKIVGGVGKQGIYMYLLRG